MYPFTTGVTYPKNQWYIAAHSQELGQPLLERRILGEVVVMFRTEAGDAVVLDGLCPHRLYPLAMSKRVGDTIQCAYHGFTFNSAGDCIKAPSQKAIPKTFCTRSYPVLEKPPYVWVWTGDPRLADDALVPDYDALGLGEGFEVHAYNVLPLKARYQLLIENLFDLTHLNFVHGMSVDGGVLYDIEADRKQEGSYLCVTRVLQEAPIEPFNYFQYGEENLRSLPVQELDQEVLTEMYNPGLIVSGSKAWQSRKLRQQDGYIGSVRFLHGVTPETETTTHYFSGFSRDVCLDDDSYNATLEQLDRKVRAEDVEVLEAIESRIGLERDLSHEISVRADAGGLRARGMIRDVIAREDN